MFSILQHLSLLFSISFYVPHCFPPDFNNNNNDTDTDTETDTDTDTDNDNDNDNDNNIL